MDSTIFRYPTGPPEVSLVVQEIQEKGTQEWRNFEDSEGASSSSSGNRDVTDFKNGDWVCPISIILTTNPRLVFACCPKVLPSFMMKLLSSSSVALSVSYVRLYNQSPYGIWNIMDARIAVILCFSQVSTIAYPKFELSLSADGSSSLLRSRSSILMTLMRIYTYEQRELLLRMPRIKISNGVQVTARACCIWELDYVPVVDCKSVVSIGWLGVLWGSSHPRWQGPGHPQSEKPQPI